MTHIFYFRDMLYLHAGTENREKLLKESDRKMVFEAFLLGKNIRGLDVIKRVAESVLKVPKERVRTITLKEFVDEFLDGDDQEDYSGNIV